MAPSGSIDITKSAPSSAAFSVVAAMQPSVTACCTEAGTRSKARTWKPALTRLAAIGPPMLPNPKNATVLAMLIPCDDELLDGGPEAIHEIATGQPVDGAQRPRAALDIAVEWL